MGMCCEKMMMIGWRNAWSMKLSPRPRGRPKRTWTEVVWEDCQARKLKKEDAMDRCKWRMVIKDVRWSGWVWMFLLVPAYPGSPGQKAVKRLCVCVLGPNKFKTQLSSWLVQLFLYSSLLWSTERHTDHAISVTITISCILMLYKQQ